jgi:hypothetical protein
MYKTKTIMSQKLIDFTPKIDDRIINGTRYLIDMSEGNTDDMIVPVSESYELVRNEDIISPLIAKFGIDNVVQASRSRHQYMFKINTGRTIDLGSGDLVDEQIVMYNSYDKTRAFGLFFGAFRHICANGMYSGQSVISYRKVHTGNIPVDRLMSDVLTSYESNSFDQWRALRDANLTVEQAKELIHGFRAFEVKPEADFKNLDRQSYFELKGTNSRTNFLINYKATGEVSRSESLNNQRNAWGVLNALNVGIDRSISNAVSNIDRKVSANKKAEAYLIGALNVKVGV